jgi:cellobiose epimerase
MTINDFKESVAKEFRQGLVPYFDRVAVDPSTRGFHGRVNNVGEPEPGAPRGLVLFARYLWYYAALYRFDKNPLHLDLARQAYLYLNEHFLDKQFGGYYWMVGANGAPVDPVKKLYGQGFVLYGLSELYQAEPSNRLLAEIQALTRLIEFRGHDAAHGGYLESFGKDWSPLDDVRLSEHDQNSDKSMNTMLHILEAYTNVYRIWKDELVADRLREMIRLFLTKIINRETRHLELFFTSEWKSVSGIVSYGHDIECSWLLHEAAEVLGDKDILSRVIPVCLELADSCAEQGIDPDGGVLYEADKQGNIIDPDKHWWPAAESAVGFVNAWQISGNERYLEVAKKNWAFIEQFVVDRTNGGWFRKVDRAGIPDTSDRKISEWTCPYHSGRACMELIHRLTKIV